MISILLQPVFDKVLEKLKINAKGQAWHIFRIFRTFLIVLIGYMFDIGKDFASAMYMIVRCITDFSIDFNQIYTQMKICGLDSKDYILLMISTIFIFFVSLKQEKNPDKTMRQMLETDYQKKQWIILMLGLLALAIFGVYGPGYNASDFVYMQF